MKRPLAVTGFTMLFTLLVLSGSNDKAISAVLLAALIAFVVFMCIKKVRRDKTLPFAALSAAVAVLLLMSNNAYYLGKAKPLNGKEVIISGTLSDLPYEKDGSFYYVLKADTVNGEKSSLSFRVVSKAPLCIDVTDEVSLSAKAFLLGGDSDEILKYYKSKSLFLGAHSPENISIKRGEKKNIGTMLLALRQKLTSETLCLLPNTYGGLVAGLCYGDKSNIPRNVTTAFSAAGVSHLLAVSGVKTLKLDIPLVPETRIKWALMPLHIAKIYILKLCLDEEIIPRCRFPCSRGYLTKCINQQKKQ